MEWYLKCLKQYIDFNGRARRKELWMFVLFNTLISILLAIVEIGIWGLEDGISPFSTLYSIAVLLPDLAVQVRRMHDIGKSGWNLLWILLPIVGWVTVFIWLCTEGEHGSNDWGEDPKKA